MASRNPEVIQECVYCGKMNPHWTYRNGTVRKGCKVCYNATPILRKAKRKYVERHGHHPEFKKALKARGAARKAFPYPKSPECASCGTIPSPPYPSNTTNGLQRSHEEGYGKPLVIKWNCPDCHYKRDRWAVGKTHGYAPWQDGSAEEAEAEEEGSEPAEA